MTDLIPDICDTFIHEGHRFRVDAWLKPQIPPKLKVDRELWFNDIKGHMIYTSADNPDLIKLEYSDRAKAEYIKASGVCTIIIAVEDITVDGKVNWSESAVDQHRQHALSLAR